MAICSPLLSLVPSQFRQGVGHRAVLGAERPGAAVALGRGPGSDGSDAASAARRGTDAPGATVPRRNPGIFWVICI